MAEFQEVTSGISKEVFFFYTFIFKESYPGDRDHPKQLKVIWNFILKLPRVYLRRTLNNDASSEYSLGLTTDFGKMNTGIKNPEKQLSYLEKLSR